MSITPAGNNLFENVNGNPLRKSQAENFHTMVSKALFISNRDRPYIHPTTALLDTKLISPNIIDCNKFVRLLKYLNGTRNYHLTFSIYDMIFIKWYVDDSFAVHPYFNIHIGSIMMWLTGATQSGSMKKNINTRSSTEEEVFGANDMASNIF